MSDPRHDLGEAAEAMVAGWLETLGWRVVARRLRWSGGGEVDLVALDPTGILVAVEVRGRRSTRTGIGTESIDARRTARLGRTLAAFGARADVAHRGLRIDLVSVRPVPGPGTGWHLRRIPNIGGW